MQKDIDDLEERKAHFDTLIENERRLKLIPPSEYTDEDEEMLDYLIGNLKLVNEPDQRKLVFTVKLKCKIERLRPSRCDLLY